MKRAKSKFSGVLIAALAFVIFFAYLPTLAFAGQGAHIKKLPEAVNGVITLTHKGFYQLDKNITGTIVVKAGDEDDDVIIC